MVKGVVVKHWSSTQSTVALSVGEAEYVALVKGAAEGIGVQSLAADLGLEVGLEVAVDSSTAKSIAPRAGVGKVRHLDTKTLWVQDVVRRRRFSLRKVRGHANPANLLTKPHSFEQMAGELAQLKATAVGSRVP